MTLTNPTTAGLAAGRYFYDLEIFTSSDDFSATRLLLWRGDVLTQEVTR